MTRPFRAQGPGDAIILNPHPSTPPPTSREPRAARRCRVAATALGVAAAILLASATHAEAARRISVQGRVVTDAGEPLGNWPVTLIATQRFIEIRSFTSGGRIQTVAETTTDAHGFYSIDVDRKRGWHYLFLRYSDPERTDGVQFAKPDAVEITADVRRGRVAEAELVVRYHPDWPEVERRLADVGGKSTPKGKILRQLGLPEKKVQNGSGEEEWWYFTHGVMYVFRGSEAVGSRQFEPVQPPAGGGHVDGEGS